MHDHEDRLTTPDYWSENWDVVELPQRLDIGHRPNRELHQLFQKYLPKDSHRRVLEIGACPASWLLYFAENFEYSPVGIEYTKLGAELARKNLQMAGVEGTILQEDIFSTSLKNNSLDVVFSMGFIEHFTDPSTIVRKHVELTKPGGLVVVGVPNIKEAAYGFWQERIYPASYEGYIHISRERMRTLFEEAGAKTIFCDYTGVFYPYLINVANLRGWKKRAFDVVASGSTALVSGFGVTQESARFSPYIFYIGEKQ